MQKCYIYEEASFSEDEEQDGRWWWWSCTSIKYFRAVNEQWIRGWWWGRVIATSGLIFLWKICIYLFKLCCFVSSLLVWSKILVWVWVVGEFGGVGVCVPRGGVGGDEQIRHPQGGGSSRILDEIRQGGRRGGGFKKNPIFKGTSKMYGPLFYRKLRAN